VAITVESIRVSVSQLLGARARAAPSQSLRLWTGFPLLPKIDVLRLKMCKPFNSFCVTAVSKYMSSILGQEVSMRPLFGI